MHIYRADMPQTHPGPPMTQAAEGAGEQGEAGEAGG